MSGIPRHKVKIVQKENEIPSVRTPDLRIGLFLY